MRIGEILSPEDDGDAVVTLETYRHAQLLLKAMLFAVLFMAVFNSEALLSWVRDLPAGTIEDEIIRRVEIWHGWMETAGVSEPITAARKLVLSWKEATW